MTEPCTRDATIARLDGAVENLKEYERKQNGALVRLTEEVGNLRLSTVEMKSDLKYVVKTSEELAGDMLWTRRLMYGTVITAFLAFVSNGLGLI